MKKVKVYLMKFQAISEMHFLPKNEFSSFYAIFEFSDFFLIKSKTIKITFGFKKQCCAMQVLINKEHKLYI